MQGVVDFDITICSESNWHDSLAFSGHVNLPRGIKKKTMELSTRVSIFQVRTIFPPLRKEIFLLLLNLMLFCHLPNHQNYFFGGVQTKMI